MRLINADVLKEFILHLSFEQGNPETSKPLVELLDAVPTALDIESVLKMLEKNRDDAEEFWKEMDDEGSFCEMNAYNNAILMLKGEYKQE